MVEKAKDGEKSVVFWDRRAFLDEFFSCFQVLGGHQDPDLAEAVGHDPVERSDRFPPDEAGDSLALEKALDDVRFGKVPDPDQFFQLAGISGAFFVFAHRRFPFFQAR